MVFRRLRTPQPDHSAQRCARLLRLTYVALLAGSGDIAVASRACRLLGRVAVAEAVRHPLSAGPAEQYEAWRRRALRRAHRAPRATEHGAGSDDDRLRVAIRRELSPVEGAAYALHLVEDMSVPDTAAEMAALGVPNAHTLTVRTVAKIRRRTGLDESAQRRLLRGTAFSPRAVRHDLYRNPWFVHLLRHPLRSVVVVAAGALVCAWWAWPAAPPPPASYTALSKGDPTRLNEWPIQGDLRADRRLLRHAAKAWDVPRPEMWPPYLPPVMLFAGLVGGAQTVVMTDGQRIARYVPSRAAISTDLTVDPVTAYEPGPVELAGGVYLAPPETTDVQISDVVSGGATWRHLPLTGGTFTLPPAPSLAERCAPRLIAVTGRFSVITYLYSSARQSMPVLRFDQEGIAADHPIELTRQAAAVLSAIHCTDAMRLDHGPLTQVDVTRFGRVELPGGGDATFVSITVGHWSGSEIQSHDESALMLVPADRKYAATDSTPCDSIIDQNAASSETEPTHCAFTWWRSPSGHWYLVATASTGRMRILSSHFDQDVHRHTLVLPAQRPEPVSLIAEP